MSKAKYQTETQEYSIYNDYMNRVNKRSNLISDKVQQQIYKDISVKDDKYSSIPRDRGTSQDSQSLNNIFGQSTGAGTLGRPSLSPPAARAQQDGEYMLALKQRAAQELNPVVFTSKYMLRPIDQNDISKMQNSNKKPEFHKKAFSFMNQQTDIDKFINPQLGLHTDQDGCDCQINQSQIHQTEMDVKAELQVRNQKSQFTNSLEPLTQKQLPNQRETLYRDEYLPVRYDDKENLLDNSVRNSDHFMQSEPTKKKRQVSFNLNSQTQTISPKPPIGKIIKYKKKVEPETPESQNESFTTDLHKPLPIKRPQIPNQKRKKSLKKQYEQLQDASSNFSRQKESSECTDQIINLNMNSNQVNDYNSKEVFGPNNEIKRNLSPNVMRLDHDESCELNNIYFEKTKPSNQEFLKSLKNISSKVGSFQDKNQKLVSMKHHIQHSEMLLQKTRGMGITDSMNDIRRAGRNSSSMRGKSRTAASTAKEYSGSRKLQKNSSKDNHRWDKRRSTSSQGHKIFESRFSAPKSYRSAKSEISNKYKSSRSKSNKQRKYERLNRSHRKSSISDNESNQSFFKFGQNGDRNRRKSNLSTRDVQRSSDSKRSFRIRARSISKKDDDLRSQNSFKSIPRDKKLMMYKDLQSMNNKLNLGMSTLKNMKKAGKTINSQRGFSERKSQPQIKSILSQRTRQKSAQKHRKHIEQKSTITKKNKPPVATKQKTDKLYNSRSRAAQGTKLTRFTSNSQQKSTFQKKEKDNKRKQSAKKKTKKIDINMPRASYQSTAMISNTNDLSDSYSPLRPDPSKHSPASSYHIKERSESGQENQNFTDLKRQNWRNGISFDDSRNSVSRNRSRLSKISIRSKISNMSKHRRSGSRSRSQKKPNKSLSSTSKRMERTRSQKSCRKLNRSRSGKYKGTLDTVTSNSRDNVNTLERSQKLDFRNGKEKMQTTQVKHLYGELREKSTQLNSLLDQLSKIVEF